MRSALATCRRDGISTLSFAASKPLHWIPITRTPCTLWVFCRSTPDNDHALEWISRAIRQEPKAVYLTSLGSTLVNQGRSDEALKAFDKAVQLKPIDADLWRNLGAVLIEVKRPADAILSFQHALKLNPRHWDAANMVALLLYQSERFEDALPYYNLCDES